jgi:intraflagellar transport protein 172
MAMEM